MSEQYTFSTAPNFYCTPKAWYQAASEQPGFIRDIAQVRAIEALEELWCQLVDFKHKRNRFLGRSLCSPAVPKGLYFWGGVGRGKSFLMDAFYDCVPYCRKRRIHFHLFMSETQHALRAFAGQNDPLLSYAKQIACKTRLLCFDEFHVSDIANAMILGRLLAALFELGVVLVVTSNYEPDSLYPDGLQRQRFLPAIDLIKQNLTILNIDGGQDYRLRELTREPLFLVPDSPENEAKIEARFLRLCGKYVTDQTTINILGREIPIRKLSTYGAIWFDFTAICDGPRAQTDYLEIAAHFHTVFISGIPKMGLREASVARRFTWLIDVLYDCRVKLVITAAVPVEALYVEGIQASEFLRTISRLTEMQTESYLALPRQTANPEHNELLPGG